MAQTASSVLDYIVPASDLNHGKAAQIISRVQVGSPVIIVKRSVPTAVVITPEEYREYERLREAREDAADRSCPGGGASRAVGWRYEQAQEL